MHKKATDPDLILRRGMPPEAAFQRAADALNAVGRVTERDDPRRRLRGETALLDRRVELEVRVREHGDGAQVEVLAFSWVGGVTATDAALHRFEEAYDRLGEPGFRPDPDGASNIVPWLVIGVPALSALIWLLERLGLLPS